jgi:hypothetical protein
MGLLRAAQRLVPPLLHLVGQHRLHAALQKADAHALERVAADVEGLGNGQVAPAIAEFEQYLRAGTGPGTGMAAMHDRVQTGTVHLGQRH